MGRGGDIRINDILFVVAYPPNPNRGLAAGKGTYMRSLLSFGDLYITLLEGYKSLIPLPESKER
ncbi:hypothetical protein SAMN04488004_12218 [Loktanella salsilacus]|uniref:Uncharacterized protein n=1 Tax=Loktanella salsilacus TaxID=195913 RepID=A0A1I4I321_9RHOB|nr:hypothetical protein SAMN04488004_12218 [Loktanella salsilacus]